MSLQLNLYNGIRVMYVDANPEDLQAFGYALVDECSGDNLLVFVDPVEALTVLHRDPDFAVIVSELHVRGDRDGIQFLRQAAEVAPLAARIILTSSEDPKAEFETRPGGPCHHWCSKGEVFAGVGKALVRIIRRAADQYAQGYMGRLHERHHEVIQRRLRMRDIDPKRANIHLRPIVRLCTLLLHYLDMPLLDKWLLRLAVNHYDMGRGAGATQTDDARITAAVLYDLEGLEKVHKGIVDWMERWNGGGPSDKHGEQISLFGRIIAVLHAFDQGVGGPPHDDRPQLDALVGQALAHLHGDAGTSYDPQVVQVFAQMVGERRTTVEALYRQEEGA